MPPHRIYLKIVLGDTKSLTMALNGIKKDLSDNEEEKSQNMISITKHRRSQHCVKNGRFHILTGVVENITDEIVIIRSSKEESQKMHYLASKSEK